MYKATILMAEDKNEFITIYGDRLRFAHFNVLTANNGEEALTVLRDKPVDILITDINMPKKDGYELIKDVRADEKLKHIPIIVMSVYDQGDHIKKALDLGADDYLVKGMVTPNALSEKVDALLVRK